MEEATSPIKDKNKNFAQIFTFVEIAKCIDVNKLATLFFLPLILKMVIIPFFE
jgi:hypothetical protein